MLGWKAAYGLLFGESADADGGCESFFSSVVSPHSDQTCL